LEKLATFKENTQVYWKRCEIDII